jgi:hypothetical protein
VQAAPSLMPTSYRSGVEALHYGRPRVRPFQVGLRETEDRACEAAGVCWGSAVNTKVYLESTVVNQNLLVPLLVPTDVRCRTGRR